MFPPDGVPVDGIHVAPAPDRALSHRSNRVLLLFRRGAISLTDSKTLGAIDGIGRNIFLKEADLTHALAITVKNSRPLPSRSVNRRLQGLVKIPVRLPVEFNGEIPYDLHAPGIGKQNPYDGANL